MYGKPVETLLGNQLPLFNSVFIFQHPNYNGNIFLGNDISLVYIEEGMELDTNEFAAAIPMAEEGSDWMGAECVITGWGEISLGNSFH